LNTANLVMPSDTDSLLCRDGHYGLYLDETLFDGSSAPCPTFDNEPLCSAGERKGGEVTFECVGLEVWGVSSP
jgi:TLD